MYLNLAAICVAVGVVLVTGGCVEDHISMHGHHLGKESRLKDVELIGKDLKFKLDPGLVDKELLEKTLHALKAHILREYEASGKGIHSYLEGLRHLDRESHSVDAHGPVLKSLEAMLGSDFKKEDFTEQDLKFLAMFMKHFLEGSEGESFLKEDDSEKALHTKDESFVKVQHEGRNFDKAKVAKLSTAFLPEEEEDDKTYLAEGVLHSKMNKDAEGYVIHESEAGKALLEELDKAKTSLSAGTFPYFLMDDEAKAYFEAATKEKQSDIHAKAVVEEDFEKALKMLKGTAYHDESAHAHSAEIAKGIGLGKTSEEAKGLEEQAALHKEHALNFGKDHIYDEILKKEEVHSLGDAFEEEKLHKVDKGIEEGFHASGDFEKAHGIGKAVRESKAFGADASFHVADEYAGGKAYDADHAIRSMITKSAEVVDGKIKKGEEGAKEASVEDILKEDGYYISGGTHAYEAARDKAHEDAKIPLVEEKHKSIDSGFAHADEERKILKGHEIGSEFAKGKETLVHSVKGTDEIFKEDKLHGIDGGLDEAFIKHAIQSDESHLIHDSHAKPKEHHFFEAGKVDETPHSKAHGLKSKLLKFLGRVMHMRKCHLVTMPPMELLGIVDCISRSKDPLLCEKFAMCESKMPLQVVLALEKCQKETIPGEMKRCTKYEPLYPSPDIPLKIFKCMVKNTHELTPVEKKQMIDFEECARLIKAESCGRIPWG